MGFIDHSTNNIIVDAVLTDKGRQLLARNDGSFQITRFSFGDDEVDYQTIRQFGQTVGKEKTLIILADEKSSHPEKKSCDGYDGKSARLFVVAFDAFIQTQSCKNSALVKMVKGEAV